LRLARQPPLDHVTVPLRHLMRDRIGQASQVRKKW